MQKCQPGIAIALFTIALVVVTTYVSIKFQNGVALDRMKIWFENDPCMLLKDKIGKVYMNVNNDTGDTETAMEIPLECPNFECSQNHPGWIEYQKIVESDTILKQIPQLSSYCVISTGKAQPIGYIIFFGWAFLSLVLVIPFNAWITTLFLWRRFYAVYISSTHLFLFEHDAGTGTQNIIVTVVDDCIFPVPSQQHTIDLAPRTLRSTLRLMTAPFQAFRFWNRMEFKTDSGISQIVYDRAKLLAFVRFVSLTVFLLLNIISAGIIITL